MTQFNVSDKVVVLRCDTHPHLKGRTGIVDGVRGAECYVEFRRTVKQPEQRVWLKNEDLKQ